MKHSHRLVDSIAIRLPMEASHALKGSGESRPKSGFKWSDVMFESFNSGYIKTIDLKMLQSLDKVVGRFTDERQISRIIGLAC